MRKIWLKETLNKFRVGARTVLEAVESPIQNLWRLKNCVKGNKW